MQWIFRQISFFLDEIIYSIIPAIYNLFIEIAETTIFSADLIDTFASRIYGLLGIFMLFKVSFSVLTYIINPDDFTDKNKGFQKVISNILISLALLVVTPWIFDKAMEIQRIILRDNVIGRLILGSSSTFTSSVATLNPGQSMSYQTLKAFYYIDLETYPECKDIYTATAANLTNCRDVAFGGSKGKFEGFVKTLQYSERAQSPSMYLNRDLILAKDNNGDYTMAYTPIISAIAGIFIAWILVMFCFDIAVRSIKLGFYRLIAPIPIISRVDPKSAKDGLFKKWVTDCLKTYLDIFIRLLAIYFAIFVISSVTQNLTVVNSVTGNVTNVSKLAVVFIIIGALMFAKNLPKLLEKLGFKLDGMSFTLDPRKKLSEVPIVGAASSKVLGGMDAVRSGLSFRAGMANATKIPLLGGDGKTSIGHGMKYWHQDQSRKKGEDYEKMQAQQFAREKGKEIYDKVNPRKTQVKVNNVAVDQYDFSGTGINKQIQDTYNNSEILKQRKDNLLNWQKTAEAIMNSGDQTRINNMEFYDEINNKLVKGQDAYSAMNIAVIKASSAHKKAEDDLSRLKKEYQNEGELFDMFISYDNSRKAEKKAGEATKLQPSTSNPLGGQFKT